MSSKIFFPDSICDNNQTDKLDAKYLTFMKYHTFFIIIITLKITE